MVASDPPSPPVPATGLPPEDQAAILIDDYVDAMAWGSSEAQMRQVLIDYIRRVKAWYDRTH